MKKALLFILIFVAVVAIAVFTWQYQNQPKRMTFAECEETGGTVWLPNPFHPDICPSCTNSYQCRNKYGDLGHYCQEQLGPEWSKNESYKKCVDNLLGELDSECPKISTQCEDCVASKYTDSRYLDECSSGMQKIGEISDSATWHQCCK